MHFRGCFNDKKLVKYTSANYEHSKQHISENVHKQIIRLENNPCLKVYRCPYF